MNKVSKKQSRLRADYSVKKLGPPAVGEMWPEVAVVEVTLCSPSDSVRTGRELRVAVRLTKQGLCCVVLLLPMLYYSLATGKHDFVKVLIDGALKWLK